MRWQRLQEVMSFADTARLQRERDRDRRDAAILTGCQRVIDELRCADKAPRGGTDAPDDHANKPQSRYPEQMAAFEAEVLDPDSAIVDALAERVAAMPSDVHRGPAAWQKHAARDFLLDLIDKSKAVR